MGNSLHRWLTISFFNLLLVASLGVIMRYKIAFYFPVVNQEYVLRGHSQFAFAGWLTQTLMVLLVHYLSLKSGEGVFIKYRGLLWANLITAYGMLVSFIIQGYALFSISFSTLSIIVSYFFAAWFWKDLNRIDQKNVSHLWFKSALLFSIISSIGFFGLAYMMANKVMHQNWYLAATYFFLHFQYNGWFFFSGMGLFVAKLENQNKRIRNLKTAFLLFCFACAPAYFLSALWLSVPRIVYWIIILSVISQLFGWVMMIHIFVANKTFIQKSFSKYGKMLVLLSAIALSVKLLLQSGSLHPALSQISYGFRPIVIGYLHLVLLGVISTFIIGYIVSFELVPVTNKFVTGVFVFVSGIIINEILLMMQGVTALSYTAIPNINILLLVAAVILFVGIFIVFASCLKLSNEHRCS